VLKLLAQVPAARICLPSGTLGYACMVENRYPLNPQNQEPT